MPVALALEQTGPSRVGQTGLESVVPNENVATFRPTKGDLVMLGVRFDQFLASTAIALLVAGTAGGQAVKPAPAATVTEVPATTQPFTVTGGDDGLRW